MKKIIAVFFAVTFFILILYFNQKSMRQAEKNVENSLFDYARNGDLTNLNQYANSKNLQSRDCHGRTPIFYAAGPDVMELLIARGIDINHCIDDEGISLLQFYCMQDKTENAGKLIPLIDDINRQDQVGGNPLIWSIVRGNTELVRVLLDNNADVSVRLNNGMSVIEIARKNKNRKDEIIEMLERKIENQKIK